MTMLRGQSWRMAAMLWLTNKTVWFVCESDSMRERHFF